MLSWYSDLLHDSAARWGLTTPAERPLIDDATNPYQQPQIVEVLHWQDALPYRKADISLVTLNGRWSYCLKYAGATDGVFFPALCKFCTPYPDRASALGAAIASLKGRRGIAPKLLAWLETLQPAQLQLRFQF